MKDKNKKRSSLNDFFQAFGLLKESQIGEVISQIKNQDEEISIEDILKDEEMEYYLNNELNEDDFVKKEFMKLSSRAGHYETNNVLKNLERINRIIEKRLNSNCLKHYGSIAKGLKNIESLGDDNLVSLTKISVIRNIINTMRNQVTQQSIQIIHYQKQILQNKKALDSLEKIMRLVGDRFKIMQDLIINPNNFQFLKCHIIFNTLREIKSIVNNKENTQLQNISAFNNIENIIENKYKIITEIVLKNWYILHRNYEEESFYNNLLSQYILEKKESIQQLDSLKHQQLIQISDEIIIQQVKQHVDQDNYNEQNIIQCFNYISKDKFLSFLQKIYSSFTKLMINYHLISRWFVNYNQNESTQFLKTDWSDNLLDDESLNPIQQRDIFLEYVQSQKNIYLQDRKSLWSTIEQKVKLVINHSYQINQFSENELISFLKLTSDFIGTGIQYSNSESENIRLCVNQKIVQYYQQFIINFQKSIQQSLSEENWEQLNSINYLQLQNEFNSIINTPLQKEFVNSIQYILPELKIENIETYSPQNNSKYLSSSPVLRNQSLTQIDDEQKDNLNNNMVNQIHSPSLERINSDNLINDRKIDLKLNKCDSMQTPTRDNEKKQDQIETQLDPKFVSKMKILPFSSLRMINGIMNSLRLIKILCPVQHSIYDAMMEVIDYYIYSLFYMLCDKSFREKLLKKFTLEHMNVNNENLIETHEQKMDSLMDQHMIQNKYFKTRQYLINQYNKFGDETSYLPGSNNTNVTNSNNQDIKSKPLFELFEGCYFELPSLKNFECQTLLLSTRVIAIESFLSFVYILEKIKPFLKSYLKRNSESINERFKIYEEIRYQFVEMCYNSILPIYIKNQSGFDQMSNEKLWNLKDIIKDIKPNPYVNQLKISLQKQYELTSKILPHEDQQEQKQYLYQLIVDYFFKAIVDNYSKIKTISLQSRGQLLVDIKQIILETEELLVWETKLYRQYLDKYLEMLTFCNADDIHGLIVKYRDIFTYRSLKSLFFLSEAGVVLKKKSRQDNQIAMLKNYQIFFRDLK